MEPVVGILIGEAPTPEEAERVARSGGKCPYCVSYTSTGSLVTGVFFIPADHRFWLEWIKRDPRGAIGLESADVFFTSRVEASSAWSRGEVTPSLKEAPCGSVCEGCSLYRKACRGCPSTVFWVGWDNEST